MEVYENCYTVHITDTTPDEHGYCSADRHLYKHVKKIMQQPKRIAALY